MCRSFWPLILKQTVILTAMSNYYGILALLTNDYLVLIKAPKVFLSCSRVYSLFSVQWCISFCLLWCIGTPRHPSHHDSLHPSLFYLKGPWTAAKLGNPPKQVVVRDIMINPKTNLRLRRSWWRLHNIYCFRYHWDSVSGRHSTSKFRMLHTPYTHKSPTIQPKYSRIKTFTFVLPL